MRASASRLLAAGRSLDGDQRFAAIAAGALLATMFLPWYEKSVLIRPNGTFAKDAISAFGAVSFVEAAIFLVSAGVLVLVLARAEGGRFHLPGGDGTVILGAGLWAAALIFYRVFDRPDVSGEGAGASVGIQWGFFVAFVAAGALALAGQRIQAATGRSSRRAYAPLAARRTLAMSRPTSSSGPTRRRRSCAAGPRARVPPRRRSRSARLRTRTRTAPRAQGPRDRAVTRADAEQLDVADPPEAPLRD